MIMPAKNGIKRFMPWFFFLLLIFMIVFLIFFSIKKENHITEYEKNIHVRLKYLESVQQQTVKEEEVLQLKNKLIALENNFSDQIGKISSMNKEIVNQSNNSESRFKVLEDLLPILKENQQQYVKQLDFLRSQIMAISEMKKSEKPVIKSKETSKAPRQLPQSKAPFAFIGTEYRGGEVFAVILPSNALSLSQIKLIGIGDGIQGWTLSRVSNDSAHFTSKERILTLRSK
ncbi:hypothetical protein PSI19_03330 [Xenorhabdus khoisanae]|uniref:hypothetical protein n=1 Tax=Xenorhabdus khoisanae TaxID=880157 RepID=UPI00235994A6|nr:hypothetical protein [Xenorhabdus khoisanae]MDC9612930.1 hypothetical protein [Xenorhabdus khoisanae]